MRKARIPRALREQVIRASRGRCAYCHTLVAITGARFVIDHIVPAALSGPTELENLCLACHTCNEFKGAVLTAVDPITSEAVALFHPREQSWREHFTWSEDSSQILGKTPIGRATVATLRMNHIDIVEARRLWTSVGWHPPAEDF